MSLNCIKILDSYILTDKKNGMGDARREDFDLMKKSI